MTKSGVSIVGIRSRYAKDFEILLKSWVYSDFLSDFHGDSFMSHPRVDCIQLMIVVENYELIGGAVISSDLIFNQFQSYKHLEQADLLQENGYDNFSYFCIKASRRKLGFASMVLGYIDKSKLSLWLACKPTLVDFYTSRGFRMVVEADERNNAILCTKP